MQKKKDYFLVGRERSAECTKAVHDEFKDVFTGIGCLQEHSHYRSKRNVSNTKYPLDMWHMFYKSHLKIN